MSIHVALNHLTTYRYDRKVDHQPHLIRLKPAPHCRTEVLSYSLKISAKDFFLNWQQDPFGNYLARCVFQDPLDVLQVEVDLVAKMAVHNPFDFFLENSAKVFPFRYESWLRKELRPYLERSAHGPLFRQYIHTIDRKEQSTVDFLVALNQRLNRDIRYLIRLEPGVQSPEDTLKRGSGSCRDSAWLMVQILRSLGLAARFASGYLIQLKPDVKSLDGPSGTEQDFTDLHAWTEVYLPGAGWIGLDPTSGLLAGEGHLPLACTPDPSGAAPITGAISECEVAFDHQMGISRIHESPRVTLPYDEASWEAIDQLGHTVDERLQRGDVRLTMGGEPTFISIDDMEGEAWNFTAMSREKLALAKNLTWRLRARLFEHGLPHFGQGKWYPGESLPRWSMTCFGRKDGSPLWENDRLLAWNQEQGTSTDQDAKAFIHSLAEHLELPTDPILPAFEDTWYYLWCERQLPTNVDPLDSKLSDPEKRKRLAKVFDQGLDQVIGYALPLRMHPVTGAWETGAWMLRRDYLFLIPGDSPMGYRLPLDSLPWSPKSEVTQPHPPDPFSFASTKDHPLASTAGQDPDESARIPPTLQPWQEATVRSAAFPHEGHRASKSTDKPHENSGASQTDPSSGTTDQASFRTALCIEPRQGILHVFMPPLPTAEAYFQLIRDIEAVAAKTGQPVVIEGETPPYDPDITSLKITPDPGVIEVNVPPSQHWPELRHITETVYEEARLSRLGTEKFLQDGRHVGTGGGNHMTLGGTLPSDSPFIRRPDLLKSLVTYWQHHPSLSFVFSGMFIGPTSQHPRVDEARHDAVYELEIANRIASSGTDIPPWLVDRLYRHLLVDVTGNTHRAEFCIDKLYAPESASGRMGLLEMRAFEMPPHPRMSLVQQLLLRSILCRLWEDPYDHRLVRWGTQIHDRFMLPWFNRLDFEEVIQDLNQHQLPLQSEWFDPHFEFRFPIYGDIARAGMQLEIRQALEPWHVLGEQTSQGATARYVDSSVERLQVRVNGMSDTRHIVCCNDRRLPLHPSGVQGEYIAGVRYRAWQPPECLHPTIGVHAPLRFDIYDTWNRRSIGGCQYHVSDPSGRNHQTFPVNAYEAESRRLARFFPFGHRGGTSPIPPTERNPDFPMTLDLRTQPASNP